MALDTFINFGDAEVSTGYDASATSVDLTAGHGARWASLTVPYNATWWNYTDYPNATDDPNREIVRVTARSTDTLTVTRGQESISATTKNTGGKTYRMLPTLTAKTLNTDLPATYGLLSGANTFTAIAINSTASPGVSFVGDGGASTLYHDTYTAATNSIYRYRRGRGTLSAPLRVKSGDSLGNIQWWGASAADDVSAASFVNTQAVFRAMAMEDFTASARGTQLEFATTAVGATANATRMTLDENNVTLASGVGIAATASLKLSPETGRGFALLQAENNPSEPGGGTDEHETDLYIFGRHDSVSNYFTGGVTLGATDSTGANTASGYTLLNEGNWTSGGGFTLSRFAIYDHSLDTEVMMHQSSNPGVVLFGRTTNGVRSLGIRVTGQEISTDADATVSSAEFNGHFIKNDTNTRTFPVIKILPSFNFGGSNTNTTVNVLSIDTTNTSVTGATVNLAVASYGGTERLRLTSVGNLKLAGTASRGTTEGTGQLVLFNGTAPAGTLTNGCSIYSASGELLAMDAGGNVANLTLPFTSTVQGVVPASGGSATHKFLTQAVTFASPVYCKSITVESPSAAEDISIAWTDDAITITKMVAVLVGSSTPSVTWTVRHGTDRSAAGAEVVTGGTTTTSITTGSVVTSFNDATIVADSFIWLETTAQSGTVGQIQVNICYTID